MLLVPKKVGCQDQTAGFLCKNFLWSVKKYIRGKLDFEKWSVDIERGKQNPKRRKIYTEIYLHFYITKWNQTDAIYNFIALTSIQTESNNI